MDPQRWREKGTPPELEGKGDIPHAPPPNRRGSGTTPMNTPKLRRSGESS